MFGKQQKQSQDDEEMQLETANIDEPEIKEMVINSPETSKSELSQMESNVDIDNPNIVNVVEKISKILSPYFIAIVGLYIYDKNYFIGTILIIIGILSLLKISYKDIVGWLEGIKNFLGFDDEEKE